MVDVTLISQINKQHLILCTNVITPSFVNDTSNEILRVLPDYSEEDYSFVEFHNVIYHDVLVRNLNFLRIYIRSWKNDMTTFGEGSLHCTLHFRRRSYS